MRIAIATPCLNALPQLKRCVGSVRRQAGVEVRHIIQDGGSTDGTVEWLARQEDLDWRSEPDSGMYDAINRAWSRANADIVAYLNADEQYLPGALERVCAHFAARPCSGAVFGDALIVDAEHGSLLAARPEIPARLFYLLRGHLYAQSCALFFHVRALTPALLQMDSRYRIVGDLDLVLRLLRAGRRIDHLSVYLGLFGATGANLSEDPAAAGELQELHAANPARGGRLLVPVARGARCVEKLLRGCYTRRPVSYEFCTDEHGHAESFHVERPDWRWCLDVSQD